MKPPKGKYAWTVKVGEKGQIVIPKEARTVFNITKGDTLLMLGDEKQGIAIVPKEKYFGVMKSLFNDSNNEEDG